MVIRTGVVGHPISHSLSPKIYNTWFADVGIAGQYEAVDVVPENFETTVRQLARDGWRGVNVTIPHKTAAYEIADYRNPEAERVGAANLLVFSEGKIIADNTDVAGFRSCLQSIPTKTNRAVVLGAGGAAGAIIAALSSCGEVSIVNRTLSKAGALSERADAKTQAYTWDALPDLLQNTDFLINTTSLGMTGQPRLEIDLAPLPQQAEVYDIVYTPLETEFLKAAKARGLRAVGGLSMLVYQAVPSFKAYTGVEISDVDAMLRSLEEVCG
ncbi:MAG: shikimate dehydrogenase [Pseudomonadota bacterium]